MSSGERKNTSITVEYHRPSRQSIQEYNNLLNDTNQAAAAAAVAANYKDPFSPSRQAPLPPGSAQSLRNQKSSTDTYGAKVSRSPSELRRRPSDPFAAHSPTQMPPPPSRPSRNNTASLNDIYNGADRSAPPPPPPPPPKAEQSYYPDNNQNSMSNSGTLPPLQQPSNDYYSPNSISNGPSSGQQSNPGTPPLSAGARSRKSKILSKNGMFGFMSDILNTQKKPEISTPYDPVHLTHVGFNSSTGEFTGLPKEWQQLLQESGISKQEQEKNPLAVMEIVKFYQEGGGDVWDKMGGFGPSGSATPVVSPASPAIQDGLGLQNPVRNHEFSMQHPLSFFLSELRLHHPRNLHIPHRLPLPRRVFIGLRLHHQRRYRLLWIDQRPSGLQPSL